MRVRSAVCGVVLLVAIVAARAGAAEPRVVDFAGHAWTVKASAGERVGPGPNHFSDSSRSVWVDAFGRLHLRIARRGGRWHAAEVVSREPFGHGTYRFVLDTPVDALPPSVVLGLFTWDDDPAFANRELDVEFSRWASPFNTVNAQYAVQPYERPGHLRSFVMPAVAPSTHLFAWQAGSVRFRSLAGFLVEPVVPSDVIAEWVHAAAVPPAGAAHARMNLWLFQGRPPADGKAVEVIVADFAFEPDAGAAGLRR